MNHPNLFDFATSELSQDAFICWQLSWACPEYQDADPALRDCAVGLLQALFKKHNKALPESIDSLKIHRQDHNIDVLCIVNDKYAVLIEDKTGTANHSDQLVRYLDEVKSRALYEEKNILPIYFKTEVQGRYSDILEAGYQLFLRPDILQVLNLYQGNNAILIDYRSHLQKISMWEESYIVERLEKWYWYSWMGFYSRLQSEGIDCVDWGYVPNPRGGFLAFWWHFQGDDTCGQYLQLEEDKLCFKIWVKNKEERYSLRQKWSRVVMAENLDQKFGLDLNRPKRFGSGEYMTICLVENYRQVSDNGLIDMNKTLEVLKTAEKLLALVQQG